MIILFGVLCARSRLEHTEFRTAAPYFDAPEVEVRTIGADRLRSFAFGLCGPSTAICGQASGKTPLGHIVANARAMSEDERCAAWKRTRDRSLRYARDASSEPRKRPAHMTFVAWRVRCCDKRKYETKRKSSEVQSKDVVGAGGHFRYSTVVVYGDGPNWRYAFISMNSRIDISYGHVVRNQFYRLLTYIWKI